VGGNGENSSFDDMTAIGGGGGGAYNSLPGVAGGSGGGGAAKNTSGGAGTAGPPRQGYDGGDYASSAYSDNGAGGGGGAGAPGEDGDQSRTGPGGDGGVGVEYSQFADVGGSPAGWFGGGGGGSGYTPGSGSSGGGGVGGNYSTYSQTAGNGIANTGGAGGGGWDVPTSGAPGGKGGSGIVIIRYLTPAGISSSALVVNSIGNVGINASSPGAKLDIVYNSTGVTTDANKVITANTTGATFDTTAGNLANYGAYFTNTSTESAGSNNLTNIALYLAASGADANYALITNGGNVGIGTTAPTALFSVAEKFLVDSNGNITKINNVAYSWPSGQGSANSYLKNDGTGNLSWAEPDGWASAGTFTYASAASITVASGAAAIYQKGDKLKLTQSTGGTKYFYVVDVADTVLTITAGSSYTLNSEAITAPYYSHIENPIGFPDWFAYTPAITVSGGTAPTYTDTFVNRFCIKGKQVFVISHWYNAAGGTAGAGTNPLNFTLPVSSTNVTYTILGTGQSWENGGTMANTGIVLSASTTVMAQLSNTTNIVGNDQSSSVRRFIGNFNYEM
jgi:hypothetical protein